ncbi:MAG: alpha/beta fold hydrolase [Bdellovibrionota bacterium]
MPQNRFIFLLLSVLIYFFYCSTSLAQNSCWSEVKNAVIEKDKQRDLLYRRITHLSPGINDRQGSLFLEGHDPAHALVLIHGYPSYPRHFSGLAKILNEKYGYTIYAPLLSGLGGPAKVGNKVKLEDWRKDVDDALTLARHCANKVSLVGHSMGGGVAIDTIFNPINSQIDSLILISPMIKTQSSLSRVLATIASTLGIKTFGVISTNLVKQVFRVIDNIQEYWDHLPRNNIPTFLSVTMDDKILDPFASLSFPSSKLNIVDQLIFPQNSGVGHNEIITPKNIYLDELAERLDLFLKKFFKGSDPVTGGF